MPLSGDQTGPGIHDYCVNIGITIKDGQESIQRVCHLAHADGMAGVERIAETTANHTKERREFFVGRVAEEGDAQAGVLKRIRHNHRRPACHGNQADPIPGCGFHKLQELDDVEEFIETAGARGGPGPGGQAGLGQGKGAPAMRAGDGVVEAGAGMVGHHAEVLEFAGYLDGGASGSFQVFDETNEVVVSITASGPDPHFRVIYFASTDCSGTPYFHEGQGINGGFALGGGNGRLFAIEETQPSATVSISSILRAAGDCDEPPPEDLLMFTGREVFLDLSFPLPKPLYVAPAPQP